MASNYHKQTKGFQNTLHIGIVEHKCLLVAVLLFELWKIVKSEVLGIVNFFYLVNAICSWRYQFHKIDGTKANFLLLKKRECTIKFFFNVFTQRVPKIAS